MFLVYKIIGKKGKLCEEPGIESVVSLVMEQIVSSVEMSENRNILNVENSDKVVKKATNRRGQKNVESLLPPLKPELLGNMNLE